MPVLYTVDFSKRNCEETGDYSEETDDSIDCTDGSPLCDCCGQPGAGRRDAVIIIYCIVELLLKR